MENTTRTQDTDKPSPLNSPRPTSANCGGGGMIVDITTVPPLTPKSIPASRSEPNPYPTTFVQADTSNFKHVVQMLTGSSETVHKNSNKPAAAAQSDPPSSSKSVIPPIRAPQKNKQHGYKLYERRNHNHLKNSLIINTLVPGFIGAGSPAKFSPREILSPSILDFPKLSLSPITPLNHDDTFNTSSSPSVASSSSSEEEKAIAEKGFYLHPSPMNTPRGAEPPQLLPLFPVTSPRVFLRVDTD